MRDIPLGPELLAGSLLDMPGVVEAVLYGSLVRGDFVDGCSDVDVFVVTEFNVYTNTIRNIIKVMIEVLGVNPRQIDLSWCTRQEILEQKCSFKFLTIYRDDFEANHILLYGEEIHELQQPLWDPRERCGHLQRLLSNHKMRKIVMGETVKLALRLAGYRGPWDKQSVMSTVQSLIGDDCPSLIWRSYLECKSPPHECLAWVERFLSWCSRNGLTGKICVK